MYHRIQYKRDLMDFSFRNVGQKTLHNVSKMFCSVQQKTLYYDTNTFHNVRQKTL